MSDSCGQKWYAKGLRFECERCGDCCTGEAGYVWVTPEEAGRIAQFLRVSVRKFGSKYLRKAGSHDSLVELPDGRCIFYGGGACTIYPVRPVQCRTFPFWRSIIVSPEAWRRCREKCPGIGQGRLYSAVEIEEILRVAEKGVGGEELHPR